MAALTKAEERIMQILWDLERGFIKDILEKFPEPRPPYNTVSTIVRVLVKKGIVSYKSYGGSYQYYPMITKDEYSDEQMNRLMKNYFNDSLKQVVSFFSNKEDLDIKEVDEVVQMLEQIREDKKKSDG